MALVESPDVPVISFTGQRDTGRRIADVAARRLKRLSLELGGKNAIVVLADADLDLAVEGILWSAFGTTGQRCTACSRVIVQSAVADALVERLVDRRRGACGWVRACDPATQVGPLINAAAVDKVERYVRHRPRRGRRARLRRRAARPGRASSTATSSAPTIFDGVRPDGPARPGGDLRAAAVGHPGPDYDAAVTALNQVRYGLSSSIYTPRREHSRSGRCATSSTGIVYVNAGTIGAETHLPFGGTKRTGNGHREAGHAALDTFTEWKSIYVDYSRPAAARPDRQPAWRR